MHNTQTSAWGAAVQCIARIVNLVYSVMKALHCIVAYWYTYSIVNVLHCYIFYGDFLVCTTMRVCYAWRLLAFFREMIRSRKGIGVLQLLSNGSPDKNCQLNIKIYGREVIIQSQLTTQSCRNIAKSMANTEAQWCLRSLEIKSVVGITSSNLVYYIGSKSRQW